MNRMMRSLLTLGVLGLFGAFLDFWRNLGAYIWST